jgi:hypothetical protein
VSPGKVIAHLKPSVSKGNVDRFLKRSDQLTTFKPDADEPKERAGNGALAFVFVSLRKNFRVAAACACSPRCRRRRRSYPLLSPVPG